LRKPTASSNERFNGSGQIVEWEWMEYIYMVYRQLLWETWGKMIANHRITVESVTSEFGSRDDWHFKDVGDTKESASGGAP
jgi:hypothetical protein